MRIRPSGSMQEESAALRRLAQMVGDSVESRAICAAATEEAGRMLGADLAALARYEGDAVVPVVGLRTSTGDEVPLTQARVSLGGYNVSTLVRQTDRAARIEDYADATGAAAEIARRTGVSSAVGAPIRVGDRVWGVLSVLATSGRPLPPHAEAQLTVFAELVAIGIASRQQQAELRESLHEQAALRRLATLVARGSAPEDVYVAAAAEAGRLLSGDRATLCRYDGETVASVLGSWSRSDGPLPAPLGSQFRLGQQDLVTLVFHARRPVRIDDYGRAGATVSDLARRFRARKAVGVPIEVDGRLWGVLIVSSTREEALSPRAEARLAGFTELIATAVANAQARLDMRRFADEQAALRRVATLVAQTALPDRVFATVAEEVGRVLEAGYTVLSRYDVDGAATVVGGWARIDAGRPLAIGLRVKPDGRNIHALVFETRRPARIDDYSAATGELAEVARDWGYRSAVGVPIIVEGRMWGVVIVGSLSEPLAADTEVRLVGFTELVAAAIANAQAQAALTASRARIVAAGDTARRRLERNLHDGAQQHLVALSLQLRQAQATIPPDVPDLESRLDEVATGIGSVLDELGEIARGSHPAGLSEGGLHRALRTLAARSAVPVRLDAQVETEISDRIGVAAYYVVAESLANAGKYAQASSIDIRARVFDEELLVSVRDDGRGGADPAAGSGLVGLRDRVEALGGRLWLRSASGAGTTVDISLPLSDADPGAEVGSS